MVDDAIQYFHERHFDGVGQVFLKYQITQEDINRGRSPASSVTTAGIVTTTASATIDGASTTFSYEENSNYLQIPPAVIGINKIFQFAGANTVTNNMFSVKYQLFLNDVYFFGNTELLSYSGRRQTGGLNILDGDNILAIKTSICSNLFPKTSI